MVVEIQTLVLLASAVLITALTPGPDFMYILSHSVSGDLKRGLVAVAGIFTGLLFYAVANAAGFSLLLSYFPIGYSVLKVLGVLYLVYVGLAYLKACFKAGNNIAFTQANLSSNRAVYFKGICINVLNPKTSLFFLAFLPQFVDEKIGHISLQLLILGIVAIVTGGCVYAMLALVQSQIGKHCSQYMNKTLKWIYGASGLFFIGFAVHLGWSLLQDARVRG